MTKIIPDVVDNQALYKVPPTASVCDAAKVMTSNRVSAVLVTDHINFTGLNPLIGAYAGGRARITMHDAYDKRLQRRMKAASANGIALREGVLMWFSGPSWQSPAEARMARILKAAAEDDIEFGRWVERNVRAHKHPEMRAAINFVGGWMGAACSTASTINQTLFKRGAAYGQPTLWLYGDNDSYYPLSHSRSNFEAYRAAGGKGTLNEYKPAAGQNGHGISFVPSLWEATMEAYLSQLGLPARAN